MLSLHRIENEEGKGPYLFAHLFPFLFQKRKPSPFAPDEPWHRVAEACWKKHQCAFSSQEQMLHWFSREEIELMREHGFLHRVYEVDQDYVLKGVHQYTFQKDKAIRLEVQDGSA